MNEQTSLVLDSGEQPTAVPPTALADLRAHAMNVPAERMEVALSEYAVRRETFREWLLSQLTEGLHYGFVPGTEPKFDENGSQIVKSWDKRANGGQGGYKETHIAQKSWTTKRNLYKAGAEFVVDLMGVRAEYAADVAAWQQLGSQPGKFVIKCVLISRATGEVVGEGIGARVVGQKGGDENNAVKMAQKSALVAAVLNSYGLSDLFTQDQEDDKPTLRDNPPPNASAPKEKPRKQRETYGARKTQVGDIKKMWLAKHPDNEGSMDVARERFNTWVYCTTNRDFAPGNLSEWTDSDVATCRAALGMEALNGKAS